MSFFSQGNNKDVDKFMVVRDSVYNLRYGYTIMLS